MRDTAAKPPNDLTGRPASPSVGKPTVIDIAREAGVSLATVDRVLNGRPGVRAPKVEAVQGAIARLGYERDIAAANLARGRTYRVVAALPGGPSQFAATLAEAMGEAAAAAQRARMAVEVLRLPPEDPHAWAQALAALPDGVTGVALMAPQTPVVRDAVRRLRDRGVRVVTLVSDLAGSARDHFVGIDSRAAGRTAARLMGRFAREGRVAVIGQSMLLSDSVERRRGFDEVMQADFPRLRPTATIETHGQAGALVAGLRAAQGGGPVDGIYLLGGGLRALDAALARHDGPRPVVIGHELTPFAREALADGRVDAVVTQSLGHLARSALRVLRSLADGAPMDAEQERLRIEIVLRDNLDGWA